MTTHWMPLYIGDYLKDTQLLSATEHGIYMLLIMNYWNDGGPITANRTKLNILCRCHTPNDEEALASVLLQFFVEKDGKIIHKRIDEELKRTSKIRKIRSQAGREGGRKSSDLRNSKGQANDQAKPQAKSNYPQPQPQSQLESKDSYPHNPPRGKTLDPEGFSKFWNAYPKHRRIGKRTCIEIWKRRNLESQAEIIITGLEQWVDSAQWQKEAGQFVPHPRTFLNQDRWADAEAANESGEKPFDINEVFERVDREAERNG